MLFHYDPATLLASLQVMWQGMAGIFAVMLLITLIVTIFTKLTK